MAETKGTGKSHSSDAASASTSGPGATGGDLQQMVAEAYRKYADVVQPARIQYEQAYQDYVDSLRKAERDAAQRYSDAFRRFQEASQETQRLMMSTQQGFMQAAQGTTEAAPAGAYQQYADSLLEAQRRQDEAYRAFSADLRQLWHQDLQRPAQDALQRYSEALQAVTHDTQQRAEEAGRAYLGSIKEFWARLDVDAAAASLSKHVR